MCPKKRKTRDGHFPTFRHPPLKKNWIQAVEIPTVGLDGLNPIFGI